MAKTRRVLSRKRRHNPKRRAGVRLFNRAHRRRPRARRRRNMPMHARRRNQPAIALQRPGTYVPYLITAGLAASVTPLAPAIFWGTGINGLWAYGTQAGVAVAGALIAPMLVRDPMHSVVWFTVSAGMILADAIGKSLVGQVFGVNNLSGGRGVTASRVGQYPLTSRYYPTAMAPFAPPRRAAMGAYNRMSHYYA